ncbi:MAG: hypothetical protein ABWY30_10190, partial [Microterricola sp.]
MPSPSAGPGTSPVVGRVALDEGGVPVGVPVGGVVGGMVGGMVGGITTASTVMDSVLVSFDFPP